MFWLRVMMLASRYLVGLEAGMAGNIPRNLSSPAIFPGSNLGCSSPGYNGARNQYSRRDVRLTVVAPSAVSHSLAGIPSGSETCGAADAAA